MDAAGIAGRSGKAVWLVQLFRLTTDDFTLRLTTGGFLVWGSELFVQRDLTYGTLGDLPLFEDGIDSQTTRADITLYPADHAALAALADRKHQTALVEVWDACVDPDTGLMVGEPDPLFRGEYDFARYTIGSSEELIIECGTEEARLNEPNEDRRLSDPHHRDVWPGELGMSYVTGVGRKIYWRVDQPGGSGGAISSGGGYVSGGGSISSTLNAR
ncbi:hypothetical protein [Brevundimonas pondensis]|uniref:DUF2163 domain-containing protein n=1 Tax=Brevundimonas pondensis TaxID=2774189 RepID=A0ABX7SME6_9CAUL|nr:hypothetical protein [Brevundimonas pondensis]QTC88193.1 hypothetical protein IFE19_01945 [Brevundimonas pondensis]